MSTQSGGEVAVIRFDSVGPSIGAAVASRAALAVGIAALAVVYILHLPLAKSRMRSAMACAQ